MSGFDTLGAGIGILSGHAGPTFGGRFSRARTILGPLIGGGRSGLTTIAPRPALSVSKRPAPGGTEVVRARTQDRKRAEETAVEVFDALATRRFSRLEGLVGDPVWTLWGDGALLLHPKRELLLALAESQGRASPAPCTKARSYTFLELRAALAQGLPEALDAVLGLKDGLFVSFEVRPKETLPLRFAVAMRPAEKGFLATSLPLPAFDEPAVLGRRPLRADDDIAFTADEVVRRSVLGQAHLLAANRALVAEQLWRNETRTSFDAFVTETSRPPHHLDRADLVFLGTKELQPSALSRVASPKIALEIERSAKDVFGIAFHKLDPRITDTSLARLDPSGGIAEARTSVWTLLVRVEEVGGARHRVAGIFGLT